MADAVQRGRVDPERGRVGKAKDARGARSARRDCVRTRGADRWSPRASPPSAWPGRLRLRASSTSRCRCSHILPPRRRHHRAREPLAREQCLDTVVREMLLRVDAKLSAAAGRTALPRRARAARARARRLRVRLGRRGTAAALRGDDVRRRRWPAAVDLWRLARRAAAVGGGVAAAAGPRVGQRAAAAPRAAGAARASRAPRLRWANVPRHGVVPAPRARRHARRHRLRLRVLEARRKPQRRRLVARRAPIGTPLAVGEEARPTLGWRRTARRHACLVALGRPRPREVCGAARRSAKVDKCCGVASYDAAAACCRPHAAFGR